jgi:hypothetical protein
MPLPRIFQFSATSLQDYVDCPRRFQLRYLLQVAWPAPEAEPIGERERHARLARAFHQLAHQYLLGLPAKTLSSLVHDPDLERWWRAYMAYLPSLGDVQIMPEVHLSTPLAGYRVMAQYDAVVLNDRVSAKHDGAGETSFTERPSFLILDWKTYRQRPSRAWLARRLQTRVYPVVLVKAGSLFLKGASVEPDSIEMCYWLAEYPDAPESFDYDAASYQADLDYLSALISEIAGRAKDGVPGVEAVTASAMDEIWPLTTELDHCRFCNYRSLCGRGGVAGPVSDYVEGDYTGHVIGDETELGFDLDWGQVQEIAY